MAEAESESQSAKQTRRPVTQQPKTGPQNAGDAVSLHIKSAGRFVALYLSQLVLRRGVVDGSDFDFKSALTERQHLSQNEGVRKVRILADEVGDPASLGGRHRSAPAFVSSTCSRFPEDAMQLQAKY